MSSEQSDLNEFARSESQQRGVPVAERIDRPKCLSTETADGTPCQLPIIPGLNWCQRHMDASERESQDHGFLLGGITSSADDVDAVEETRCPACNAPVPSMYLVGGEFHQCPECGHRRD